MMQRLYCQELLPFLKSSVENIWPDICWEPKGIVGHARGWGQGSQFRSNAELCSRNLEDGWAGHSGRE